MVDALEHVFGRIRGEIGNQLVVNREVGRKHKKVVDAVSLMQIGDERAHQAGFAHACCQRETQRGEFALEIFQRGELRLQACQNAVEVTCAGLVHGGGGFQRGCQLVQRFGLWWAQGEAGINLVQGLLACHDVSPSPNKLACVPLVLSCCGSDFNPTCRAEARPTGVGSSTGCAIGRLATLRL